MYRSLIAAGLSLSGAVATAQPASVATSTAVDYASDVSWLCRPGRTDVCAVATEATAVAGNGKLTTVRSTPAANPAVDCFYVYPTVSTDTTPNSDMTADAAERNVAAVQFAPFASVCRTFAPLYRQLTLSALRSLLTGKPSGDFVLPYTDVAAAWRDYLARDNGGRGVILIGHSQGSTILKTLLAREIEGKPVAGRVIAAYTPGTNVLVPEGKDVGGDLKSMPVCRSASQTGCVVAYVTFREETVPPADSRFGRTDAAGMQVACVNPAAPSGGRGTLKPLLPNRSGIVDNASAQPAWATGATVSTPFVELPGLLSAECRSTAGASYLAVRTDADRADPRTDTIGGDVVLGGQVVPGWGLHLIDVNVATGNLLDLARSQSRAWLAGR